MLIIVCWRSTIFCCIHHQTRSSFLISLPLMSSARRFFCLITRNNCRRHLVCFPFENESNNESRRIAADSFSWCCRLVQSHPGWLICAAFFYNKFPCNNNTRLVTVFGNTFVWGSSEKHWNRQKLERIKWQPGTCLISHLVLFASNTKMPLSNGQCLSFAQLVYASLRLMQQVWYLSATNKW